MVKLNGGEGSLTRLLETSCIILAGGKSSRLGHDKVLEKIGSQSLLERVISQVAPLGREVIIVTAGGRAFPQLANQPKLKIVSDVFPGKGSLGAVYTGLVASDSFYNLVVAADMPFLNQTLLSRMIEISEGFDFVVPRVNNLLEPLHSVYSKKCVAPIELMLKQGRRVIIELFDFVRVRYLENEEIDALDPQHLSFFNINTRQDLERARQLAAGDRT